MPNTYHQRYLTPADRFWQKVRRGRDSECWEWTASKQRGYGYFGIGSRTDGTRTLVLAHRFAYELMRGPLPAGTELDHLCKNHSCVNPNHLEAVPHQINMTRGKWGMKTHCPRGHPYKGKDFRVFVKRDGSRNRICNICRRIRWNERKQEKP